MMQGKVDEDLQRMFQKMDQEEGIFTEVDPDDVRNAQLLIKMREELISKGVPEAEAVRQIDAMWAKKRKWMP